MERKEFQAESKRLLELMIHSIYTHKEIFLREILSNASDAIDKLCYRSLTDEQVGMKREDFAITIRPDQEARTLTVSDNGIGMNDTDLEQNLGVIASSGTFQFRQELDKDAESDVIGQFGVGFYSAFMVADHITVVTRKYGDEQGWRWESDGVEGYTIEPCRKDTVGTDIIMHLKADEEPEEYSQYLQEHTLQRLVKKYSDYIRFPIRMEMTRSKRKEGCPEDKPEYEEIKEWETLNSMVPLWQRKKSEVTREEYDKFYQEHFGDFAPPQSVITVSAEGAVTYKALLFIPSQPSGQYYTEDFEPGLQLYSSGVMIMDKCADLLPECFNFVRGVVDSPDLSLNISRELLQHDRQLKVISNNLEKKIRSELERMLKDDREGYEKFYRSFGRQLKLSALNNYGAMKEKLQDLSLNISRELLQHDRQLKVISNNLEKKIRSELERMLKDDREGYEKFYRSFGRQLKLSALNNYGAMKEKLQDLLLFYSSTQMKLVTLGEYVSRMPGEQKYIYYASGDSVEAVDHLPQTELLKDRSMEILYFTDKTDEFIPDIFRTYGDKAFRSAVDGDLELGDEKQPETADHQETLDFLKETLGSRVDQVKASGKLKSHPVCLTSGEGMTFEMEKYFAAVQPDLALKAKRILEVNVEHPAFAALESARITDPDRAKKYAEILLNQAMLIAGLPLENPSDYTDLICSLWK